MILLSSLAAAAIATGCTPGDADRSAVETVNLFRSAYAARDLRAVTKVLAADAVVSDANGEMPVSELLENYENYVFKIDSPFVAGPLETLVIDDLVAQTGYFTGGGQARVGTLTVFRVDGGCIVELHSKMSSAV